jgi:hypothetical protein
LLSFGFSSTFIGLGWLAGPFPLSDFDSTGTEAESIGARVAGFEGVGSEVESLGSFSLESIASRFCLICLFRPESPI